MFGEGSFIPPNLDDHSPRRGGRQKRPSSWPQRTTLQELRPGTADQPEGRSDQNRTSIAPKLSLKVRSRNFRNPIMQSRKVNTSTMEHTRPNVLIVRSPKVQCSLEQNPKSNKRIKLVMFAPQTYAYASPLSSLSVRDSPCMGVTLDLDMAC